MSEENIEVLLQKAENGDLDSQVRLGLLHHEGNGVRKDNIMAVFWLSKVYLEDELEEDDLKIMCGILCELVTSAKIVTANLLVYDIANSNTEAEFQFELLGHILDVKFENSLVRLGWEVDFTKKDDLGASSTETDVSYFLENYFFGDLATSQPWNCLLDEHFLSVSKAMEKRAMGKEPTEEDFKLPPELPTT